MNNNWDKRGRNQVNNSQQEFKIKINFKQTPKLVTSYNFKNLKVKNFAAKNYNSQLNTKTRISPETS